MSRFLQVRNAIKQRDRKWMKRCPKGKMSTKKIKVNKLKCELEISRYLYWSHEPSDPFADEVASLSCHFCCSGTGRRRWRRGRSAQLSNRIHWHSFCSPRRQIWFLAPTAREGQLCNCWHCFVIAKFYEWNAIPARFNQVKDCGPISWAPAMHPLQDIGGGWKKTVNDQGQRVQQMQAPSPAGSAAPAELLINVVEFEKRWLMSGLTQNSALMQLTTNNLFCLRWCSQEWAIAILDKCCVFEFTPVTFS